MRRTYIALGTWIVGFIGAAFHGYAGCSRCGCMPSSCPDATVAAGAVPSALEINSSNLNPTNANRVFLLENQVLLTYTDPFDRAWVVPVQRYGCSNLYFIQIGTPGAPFDGWIPVYFQANDPVMAGYFACNTLPVIPRRTREQIAALLFPGCCAP